MKILQINKRYWDHIGGIETALQNATQALHSLGHDCTVLAVNESSGDEVERTERLTVIKAGQILKLFGMPLSWRFFSYAREELKRADLIILHHPFPLGFLVYWLFGRQKPMVVWYHSDIVRQKFLAMLIQPLLSAALATAQLIIVSNQSVSESSDVLKPYRQKIFAMPYMVDQSLPAESKVAELVARYPQPLVLSVGRLVYYKGFEYLIQAMKGVPAQLLIIGSGPLQPKLKDLIAENQLDNVEILDHVSDLTPYYHAAEIFVLPSVENSEAFGIVQVEAMLAGVPVINTSLPTGVPTVSIDRQTGLTVPPKDTEALQKAIQLLLADESLRKQYGSAGLTRAQQLYSKQAFSNNISKLLQEIKHV